jgi:hypothetical protein
MEMIMAELLGFYDHRDALARAAVHKEDKYD